MKTKALISFTLSAKLFCAFVFAYSKCWFSHDAAHLLPPLVFLNHNLFCMLYVYYVRIICLPQEGEGDGANVSSLCAPSLFRSICVYDLVCLFYVANIIYWNKRKKLFIS